MKIKVNCSNDTIWKGRRDHFKLPNELKMLDEIAHNIWWSWNYEVVELFTSIDKELWNRIEGNPVLFLQSIPFSQLEAVTEDSTIMDSIKSLYSVFEAYMNEPYNKNIPSVAYFSMEYGLSHVLKIYSGGLGILAGDYIKEASDIHADLTAVGFLYRYGYFTQSLSIDGQQIANYETQHFDQLPIRQVIDKNDQPLVLKVLYSSFVLYSYVWVVSVGRIKLYLLDTDLEQNNELDRCITSRLYGGNKEDRLKQEYLLGIGGIMLLNKLGIKKQIYHCNEGHTALINVQRLVDYIQNDKLTFNQALEVVRASSLYTCHTPVPAGHDYFEESLFCKYMNHFPAKLGISWQDFIDMGRTNHGSQEEFSMSVFALNTCQEVNGVSKLHGTLSKYMFSSLWKGYYPQELHVGYVTNGVHMPTWTASEWRKCYERHFGQSFYKDQSNIKIWEKIYQVEDEEIWNIRTTLKKRLINYISFKDNWLKNQKDPSKVVSILDKIDSNALLIGFGRRFATYKRACLLFTNLDRLANILNNSYYPVQFIFAGKAHPADVGGQRLIKHIVEISHRPEFQEKIIFLENYDMRLAKRLISGVDIWLNTPTRPLEASGTSGQKAEMNGVLNFSILDGWWHEGYREGAGWALTDKCTYENSEFQDKLDADTIYSLLENEIIPLFYAKNSNGYSVGWIQYIKNSIAQIAPHYTTKRMFDDYIEHFYSILANRSEKLKQNDFVKAKELAAWKEEVANHWSEIEIVSVDYDEGIFNQRIEVGSVISMSVVIDKHDLQADLGIEIVQLKKDMESIIIEAGTLEKIEENKLYFTVKLPVLHPSTVKYGVRVYPFNKDLPHRMDFAYVKWVHI